MAPYRLLDLEAISLKKYKEMSLYWLLGTGLVGQEPSQRWGSLFPLNAWESALPAACRPPQTGPPIR